MKEEKNNLTPERIKKALVKKALGYDAKEVVEEYVSEEEGGVKLNKKKITIKNIPPDLTALKLLMDGEVRELSDYSDEELEKEKQRLLTLLKKTEKGEKVEKLKK